MGSFNSKFKSRSRILAIIWIILSAFCWSIIVYSNNQHFELILRVLGLLAVPAFTGFGWRYVLEGKRDKVGFVTSWCLAVTVLYYLIGVVRVGFSRGGFTSYALTASTIFIVVIYGLGYHKKRHSGIMIVANLIVYTLLSYLLLLEHLEIGISVILQENDFLYLFLTDVTYFGVISSLAAHVFLLDLIENMHRHDMVVWFMEQPSSIGYNDIFQIEKRNLPSIRKYIPSIAIFVVIILIAFNVVIGNLYFVFMAGGISLLLLMSIGFAFTHMMEGFPNFAHTSHAATGAITSFILTRFFYFNPYHTFPISALIGGTIGGLLYLGIVKPIKRHGKSQEIRLTFIFLIIAWIFPFLVAIFNYWTRYYANMPSWNYALSWYDFYLYDVPGIVWISILTCIASILYFPHFLSNTKLGLSLRATAENEELAAVLGVNTNRAHIISWFIAGALSALVGSMNTIHGYVDVSGLEGMILHIMTGVVLGGLNFYGAIIGPIVVFVSEMLIKNGIYLFLGVEFDKWEPLIPIAFLVITLNLFPEGITGKRKN